mmetsp:Transcript_7110/g.10580  ORF Transcript_7110/g.10580 Transcript_7110/m.10580 type:complete len:365 (+) Transcript_7110:1513-2607(+)
MCILILFVGEASRPTSSNKNCKENVLPTLIASNRDEYFARLTSKGELSNTENGSVRRYLPIDNEGGGSWLGFEIPTGPLNPVIRPFRFAIVLNYHSWRNKLPKNISVDFESLSRGNLVKNFITASSISSKDYVYELMPTVGSYRPFNLIVGDSNTGVYFISSHNPIPQQLEKGKLYGFTNGNEIHDYYSPRNPCIWEKLPRGCRRMHEEVIAPLLQSLNCVDKDRQLEILKSAVRHACSSVMRDSTPLPDPSVGQISKAACQLAAVFVIPVLINPPTATNPNTKEEDCTLANDCKIALQDHILSTFVSLNNQPPDYSDRRLFGTRNTTVLALLPAADLHAAPLFSLVDSDFDSVTQSWVHRELF